MRWRSCDRHLYFRSYLYAKSNKSGNLSRFSCVCQKNVVTLHPFRCKWFLVQLLVSETNILKSVLCALFWQTESRKFNSSKTLQHKDAPLVCMQSRMRCHTRGYISRWGSVLLVLMSRRCESLGLRNGNSAVPLFVGTQTTKTI